MTDKMTGTGTRAQVATDAPAGPSLRQTFSKGLLVENPVMRQMLGLCPTLAVSTAVTNGLGMGVATTFVLVCSGAVVSALRRVIPSSVRIPAFITIVASFVTLVMMLVQAYLPELNDALGIYLPLIVVNCIVLGRAEVFASKHAVPAAMADGLGMGVGFTIALVGMSAIRELLGAGTLLGVRVLPASVEPMIVMVTPAGGFLVLGVLIALSVWVERTRQRRRAAGGAGRAGCAGDRASGDGGAGGAGGGATPTTVSTSSDAATAESPCHACPMACASAGAASGSAAPKSESKPKSKGCDA